MLHKSTVHAGNNRWIHIKFICFMSLTILCLIGSIFLAISFGAKDIHLQNGVGSDFELRSEINAAPNYL